MSKRAYSIRDLTQSELHSAAELKCVAAVLNTVAGGTLSVDGVLAVLARGNSLLLSDACIDDPLGGTLVFEYDEGYWHRRRVQQDIDKSIAQLASAGVTRLVRLRRGVEPLAAHIADPRYVEVCTDSQDARQQARLIVAALGLEYSEAHAERGTELGALAHIALEERAQANLEYLKEQCGRRAAVHVIRRVNGVKMRIWERSWVDGLLRFRGIVGHRHMCTALCDGVASRLTDDLWFAGLERLAEALGGRERLRTALSNGVASRLTDDLWFAGLERFAEALGGREHLRTALSGGVASRLTDDLWFAGLERFAESLGGREHLRTALSNSVASRLTDDLWFAGLERFAEALGGRERLRTALSDSVASRLTDDLWFAGLERFAEALGGREHLRTALSDGVASRLTDPSFHAMVSALVRLVGSQNTARMLHRGSAVARGRLQRIVVRLGAEPADTRAVLCSQLLTAAGRGVRPLSAILAH